MENLNVKKQLIQKIGGEGILNLDVLKIFVLEILEKSRFDWVS